MKALIYPLIVPYFFLWLVNVKVPFGGEEILVQFVYAYLASLIILSIIVAHKLSLLRSSLLSVVLMSLLLIPTIFYQISGLSQTVTFDHISGFPLGHIVKLTLIFLVFVIFNELLFHNYVSLDYLFKIFVITILLSIPIYFVEFYDKILVLDVHGNRPYPDWIGGWNTYALLMAWAFVIIYKSDLWRIAKYSLLILIFLTMLTTLSRGGMLALVVALFLNWQSSVSVGKLGHLVKALLGLGVIIFAVGGVAVVSGLGDTMYDRYVTSFVESQYEGAGYLQSVSSGRTVLWLDTLWKLIDVDHVYQLFLGYGVGHYAYLTHLGEHETDMGNQYLLLLYEYGLFVGIGLWIFFFRAYFLLPWESTSRWGATIKLCTAMLIVSFFVGSFIYSTHVGWLIGLGAAILLHVLRSVRILSVQQGGTGTNPAAATTHRVVTA